MRILRLFGLLLLLAAAGVAAADWIAQANSGGPMFRSSLDWWTQVSPSTLSAFQGFVVNAFGVDFWDPIMTTILGLPAALLLALKSMAVFFIVGLLRQF
jgi:hypothetical protein